MLLVLSLPSIAYAHGVAIYASTPVTPPRGWLWVPPIFVIASIALDWFVLRKGVPPRKFIRQELRSFTWYLLALVLVGLLIQTLGIFISVPVPGFGPPFPAFYGLPPLWPGIVFLIFNVIALAVFLQAKRGLCDGVDLSATPMRRALIGGNVIIYILAIAPYIFAGAMSHGWAGGHIFVRCFHQTHYDIGEALVQYADEHDGRLPEAENFADLITAVEPYIDRDQRSRKKLLDVCPEEAAFSKTPRPYTWNADFTGARLDVSAESLSGKPMLSCPRGHRPLYFEWLIKLQEEMKRNK